MQTPNKQRRKGVHKLPRQSAEDQDQSTKTTTISLPSDADLALLSPEEGRQLTMWEQMVYGGRLNNPRTFERANTDSVWLIALTSPYTTNDLRWFMERKIAAANKRNRIAAEDTWDWTQDT